MKASITVRFRIASLFLTMILLTCICPGAKISAQEKQQGEKWFGIVRPDYSDIKYGPHERNVLDFWKAPSDKPTPVLLIFHGGGFMKGDKKIFNRYVQGKCLKNGIAVASANYRFITGNDSAPFPAPFYDAARALQFLRSKAREWNIDPTRVALGGWSAGANMALWIAFHKDLADPASSDPVARFSTRVSCVVASNAQTSNDPRFILKNIGGKKDIHPAFLNGYGIKSMDEFNKNPALQKLSTEISAIDLATGDAPPVFLWYLGGLSRTPLPEDTNPLITVHHPEFGVLLKKKLDTLGVECQLYYKGKEPGKGAVIAFLKKNLGIEQK